MGSNLYRPVNGPNKKQTKNSSQNFNKLHHNIALEDLVLDKTVFIHIQYYTMGNHQDFIREMAILHADRVDPDVYIFKHPFIRNMHEKIIYQFNQSRYEMIPWDENTYTSQSAGVLLAKYFDYNILVKNKKQMEIINKFFNYRGKIRVLQKTFERKSYANTVLTNCPYHGPLTIESCASRTVHILFYETLRHGTIIPLHLN